MHLHRQNRMLPQPQNRMPPQSSNLASMTSPMVLTGAQAAGPTNLRITSVIFTSVVHIDMASWHTQSCRQVAAKKEERGDNATLYSHQRPLL